MSVYRTELLYFYCVIKNILQQKELNNSMRKRSIRNTSNFLSPVLNRTQNQMNSISFNNLKSNEYKYATTVNHTNTSSKVGSPSTRNTIQVYQSFFENNKGNSKLPKNRFLTGTTHGRSESLEMEFRAMVELLNQEIQNSKIRTSVAGNGDLETSERNLEVFIAFPGGFGITMWFSWVLRVFSNFNYSSDHWSKDHGGYWWL